MERHPLSRRRLLHSAAALGLAPLLARANSASAQEAAPPLSAYAHLPAIDRAAISPDGTRAAFVVNRGQVLEIHDLDLISGARAYVEVADCNAIPTLIWASNTAVFFTASRTEKGLGMRYETWTGYLVDIRANRKFLVSGDLERNGRNLVGDIHRIRRDDSYFVTASSYHVTAANYTVDYMTSLYAFAFDHSALEIDHDTRPVVAWAIDSNGRALARSEYDKDTRVWSLRYFGSGGWRVIYSEAASADLPVLKGPGRDGRSVLLYFRDGRFADSYVELNPDGSFSEPLVSNRGVYTPIFDPSSGSLAGFASTAGVDHNIFYDPAYVAVAEGVARLKPGQLTEISDLSEDPNRFLLYSEGPGNAGTYEAVDLSRGTVVTIGLTYPDLPPTWLPVKSIVTYSAGDGLAIDAMLTLPPGRLQRPLAAVILPHGGPESYDDVRFDWMSQALASRGYLVLQPNFRGSAGKGRDFVTKGFGQWGRAMQTDLSDGAAWLVAQGLADPKRIAVMGASYGGYAAMAGVALQPGTYACGVAISGISDIREFMADELTAAQFNLGQSSYRYWSQFVGPEDGWDEISPIRHVAGVTAPLLLIHGRDDTVVAFEQSRRMYDALRQAGKTADLVLLDDEDHYLSKAPTREQALAAAIAFLLKNNPPI